MGNIGPLSGLLVAHRIKRCSHLLLLKEEVDGSHVNLGDEPVTQTAPVHSRGTGRYAMTGGHSERYDLNDLEYNKSIINKLFIIYFHKPTHHNIMQFE